MKLVTTTLPGSMIAKVGKGGAHQNADEAQLPPVFARYRKDVGQELCAAIPNSPPDLYMMLKYHMGWVDSSGAASSDSSSHGKSLRPILCLLSCEALGGEGKTALGVAAALEYVHNFSLIHDDIQDGDRERRHRPTVWSLWGQPQALVAGNTMQAVADATTHRLCQRGVAQGVALQASTILTQGYLEMIEGQCLDLSFEGDLGISVDDYLLMISLKTGCMFRSSMAIGALIGGGDESAVGAFARCGSFLGKAFQVRDDILGIWGDMAATGKAVGSDIRRKKMTFPVVYALERAKGDARQTLTGAWAKENLEDSDVADVLGVLDGVHAQEHAHAFTRENAHLASKELEEVVLPSWARSEFGELIQFLTTRDH